MMTAIRKDPGAEISLADLVAQMPDGCRARREYRALLAALKELRKYAAYRDREIAYDEFAYKRLVGNMKDSAKRVLAAYKEAVK